MPALKATLATLTVCGCLVGLIVLCAAFKSGNEVALIILACLEIVSIAAIIAALIVMIWYIFYCLFKEPEPERTIKPTSGGLCPDCRKLIGEGESYCAWCGAKVVE